MSQCDERDAAAAVLDGFKVTDGLPQLLGGLGQGYTRCLAQLLEHNPHRNVFVATSGIDVHVRVQAVQARDEPVQAKYT